MAEPWEDVPVQSPEGQKRIPEHHEDRLKVLDRYPTIRKYVHNDRWVERFLRRKLAGSPRGSTGGDPWLYRAPEFLGFELPDDYLDRVEKGLAFVVQHARRENRNDLIGRLQHSSVPSLTGVLEVLLAYALVEHFGEGNVEAYPRVARDTKKNVDFGVARGESTILLEAVSLFERKEVAEGWSRCLAEDRLSYFYWVNSEAEIQRLIRQYVDKASQRQVPHPLVVCLNQLTTAVHPDDGRRALEHVLESMDEPDKWMLVAAAYFTHGHFQGFHIFESQVARLKADRALLDEVRQAMERLPPQSPQGT